MRVGREGDGERGREEGTEGEQGHGRAAWERGGGNRSGQRALLVGRVAEDRKWY
ncbi:hypothetical protein GCM10010129_72890 [Streptomyces fumigatiscleroticus]|nr:hypothetical protein GCM10010129_72890 [Streptomyces fumigatiscleroticus]